ncbi:nicotinate (nicotinamide) nucleotide adenylyltransferase [Inhella sp.]|uniref:nicotinate (nicotinamide) nucleotide adenylyltransferase n=1 Tax=Inhella sp. TaxID=1921806 RepID=UPI0035B16DCD
MSVVGLFGGSFNPPHRAHRLLAELAVRELGLDELIVMPAGAPWQKSGSELASGAHRVAMAELAFAGLARVRVSRHEVEQAGPSVTVDTLRALQPPGARWWLVIGQDQYARLSTWCEPQELLRRCHLAVAARAGQAVEADPTLPPHERRVLPLPPDPVSATQLRAALKRHEDITPLVGTAVAGYIAQHSLYGA